MKTQILFGFFVLALALPVYASAAELMVVRTDGGAGVYESSGQFAWQISETQAVYAIDYKFGHGSYDLYLPARAVRDQEWNTDNERIGFSVLEDGETPTEAGSAIGVVLSSAAVTEDEMYYVPAGTAKTFRFFVILETDEDSLEADYAIQVTDLPFYRYDEREHLKLYESELQYYVTPEIEFNASNPSAE